MFKIIDIGVDIASFTWGHDGWAYCESCFRVGDQETWILSQAFEHRIAAAQSHVKICTKNVHKLNAFNFFKVLSFDKKMYVHAKIKGFFSNYLATSIENNVNLTKKCFISDLLIMRANEMHLNK